MSDWEVVGEGADIHLRRLPTGDWEIVEGAVRRGWHPEAVNALARLREREAQREAPFLERARQDALELETLADQVIAAEARVQELEAAVEAAREFRQFAYVRPFAQAARDKLDAALAALEPETFHITPGQEKTLDRAALEPRAEG